MDKQKIKELKGISLLHFLVELKMVLVPKRKEMWLNTQIGRYLHQIQKGIKHLDPANYIKNLHK